MGIYNKCHIFQPVKYHHVDYWSTNYINLSFCLFNVIFINKAKIQTLCFHEHPPLQKKYREGRSALKYIFVKFEDIVHIKMKISARKN